MFLRFFRKNFALSQAPHLSRGLVKNEARGRGGKRNISLEIRVCVCMCVLGSRW